MHEVGIYHEHHWVVTVYFRWWWQALLFHSLLMASPGDRILGTIEKGSR